MVTDYNGAIKSHADINNDFADIVWQKLRIVYGPLIITCHPACFHT